MEVGNYILHEKIGSGGDATVYTCHYKGKPDQLYAIKLIRKRFNEYDSLYVLEGNVLKTLNHPNIVKFIDAFDSPANYCIVTEYISSGTLLDRLNNEGPLPLHEVRRLVFQITDALQYLHNEKSIAHRDLKCENIMFDDNHDIKIIDFGFCRHIKAKKLMNTFCGSFPYLPPEIIRGEKYSNKCDVWGLGILSYAASHGVLPFYSPNQYELFQMIISQEPEYSNTLPPNLIYLIQRMLIKEPSKRISLDEIKASSFISPNNGKLPNLSSYNHKNETRLRMGTRHSRSKGSLLIIPKKTNDEKLHSPIVPNLATTNKRKSFANINITGIKV